MKEELQLLGMMEKAEAQWEPNAGDIAHHNLAVAANIFSVPDTVLFPADSASAVSRWTFWSPHLQVQVLEGISPVSVPLCPCATKYFYLKVLNCGSGGQVPYNAKVL